LFNQIVFAQQINQDQFWLQRSRNCPTRRSRAWKKNNERCQPSNSQSARRPTNVASRREYVTCHPKSRNNEPDQNPSEAPENKDVAGENENKMDVLNDSTECPASAANTVEDHNKLSERISDAIDPNDQPDDRSNLIIDLGPEAGDLISFEPVMEPDIWNDCSDIIFDTGPTAQPPELITTSSEMINPAVPILNSQPKPVPNSFQPFLIPYLHDQPPYHHFPSLHPPLMPFCPQNLTQSPCQVDPRSLHLTSE
jgi:hypothetical protein